DRRMSKLQRSCVPDQHRAVDVGGGDKPAVRRKRQTVGVTVFQRNRESGPERGGLVENDFCASARGRVHRETSAIGRHRRGACACAVEKLHAAKFLSQARVDHGQTSIASSADQQPLLVIAQLWAVITQIDVLANGLDFLSGGGVVAAQLVENPIEAGTVRRKARDGRKVMDLLDPASTPPGTLVLVVKIFR